MRYLDDSFLYADTYEQYQHAAADTVNLLG